MILVINISREKLHYFEFVKPVEDILKKNFATKKYFEIEKSDLENCDGVIICGTSLKDFDYLKNIDNFSWIESFEKPVFGICGGMQIIGKIFGGEVKNEEEIGYFYENFFKEFLGVSGIIEVYHLHSDYVDFSDDFSSYCNSEIPQAVKHKKKEIYGTLFHPEVRNKEMILNFANLCSQ